MINNKKEMVSEYINKCVTKEINIEDIKVGTRITGLDYEKIEDLKVSILEFGLMQPILVRYDEPYHK